MRYNPLGYEMVPETVRKQLFGFDSKPNDAPTPVKVKCESHLNQMGFDTPPPPSGRVWPESLTLPRLRGNNLKEHFEAIALEQLGSVPELADQFVQCELPPLPKKLELKLQPGWTRYGKDGTVRQVPFPEEKVFTFDTETFVQGGSYPIIGTAVSPEANYLWLAPEFLDPSLPQEEWEQYGWVPVGTGNLIIAHNAAYDRVRTAEAYSLETGLENYWLDTLSMHIACCGLAAGQRWLYILNNKDPELLSEEEKRKLRFKPQWIDKGCTNSLVECYNFHVYETKRWSDPKAKRMWLGDKAIRDVFVKANSMSEFQPLLIDLIYYALKDSWYTAELFQYLYPRYRDSTPSATALMGHFYLAASRVPVSKSWHQWVKEAEDCFQAHVDEMSAICRKLLDREVASWQVAFDLDWARLVEAEGTRKSALARLKELVKAEDWTQLKSLATWVQADPWRKQLDWTPKVIGNSKNFPEWKGKVLPNWCHKLVMNPSEDIGVKTRAAHLLLKLKWKGSPLRHTVSRGWVYWDSDTKKTEQVPHPKRPGDNVGGVLSKDFVKHAEAGILSSDLEEAKRALEIANAISYWTSVRNRVFERYAQTVRNPVTGDNDCRLTLPNILPHGTSTRRVVEPLLATLCGTKSWRIGTELKTRIEAPPGWKIVGGDFDGRAHATGCR